MADALVEMYFTQRLATVAFVRAQEARRKYPQPNYTLTKVAEEAGEVVKAGVHLAEGRDYTVADLEDEIIDAIAMLFRLALEGDQVHGVPPCWVENPESFAPDQDLDPDQAPALKKPA